LSEKVQESLAYAVHVDVSDVLHNAKPWDWIIIIYHLPLVYVHTHARTNTYSHTRTHAHNGVYQRWAWEGSLPRFAELGTRGDLHIPGGEVFHASFNMTRNVTILRLCGIIIQFNWACLEYSQRSP